MGCSVRDKHVRANRKPRSAKSDSDACCKPMMESGLDPLNYQMDLNDSNPNPNPNFASLGWGLCTEDKLEEILLEKMELIYNDAVSKLVALGRYDEDIAIKAILQNGRFHCGMDLLTNILHSSLAYLNNNGSLEDESEADSEPMFSDLRQLEEYTLVGMVSLLQQARPNLNRGDALWCLLMSDFHVGKASTIQIPVGNEGPPSTTTTTTTLADSAVGVMAPTLCRFHGGCGCGNGGGSDFPTKGFFPYDPDMTFQLRRDIEFPKRFNLSPSMKSLLKRNVAMFAAGFGANSKLLQSQAKANPSSGTVLNLDSPAVSKTEVPGEQSGDSLNLDNQDDVNSVLSKFRDLNLDENLEFVAKDQKDEVIVTLFHQIKDLEKEVKTRKDWAHQKAMQAARKLSSDLIELKTLRMERDETQRLKNGKQTLEDTTMKRLSDMENALRKASAQVDQANAAVRRLETENAEIKAEMEASKLSASESVKTCLQIVKREKKCLKRLLACEKQKARLQQEISDEKQKILEIQEELARIKQLEKEVEVKVREEYKAKEEALALIEEERRSKEAAEANNKRNYKALCLKVEIYFQRHKDDLLRLEQELSHLKASAQSVDLHHQSNTAPTIESKGAKPQRGTIATLLQELYNLEDFSEKEVNGDRACIICNKDEVSIVFLPCAHQVMCASCSEEHGRKSQAACPCCRVPIEQRIRVFGASS